MTFSELSRYLTLYVNEYSFVCRFVNQHARLPCLSDSVVFSSTALHIASGGQYASSVKLLLDSGAKDVPDLSNQLAQHLAVKQPVKDAFDGGHGS